MKIPSFPLSISQTWFPIVGQIACVVAVQRKPGLYNVVIVATGEIMPYYHPFGPIEFDFRFAHHIAQLYNTGKLKYT